MKKIVFVFMLVTTIILGTEENYAHDIFYQYQSGTIGSEPYVGVDLKWNERISGKAYLKINSNYLSANIKNQCSSVFQAWQNSNPSKVHTITTSLANSNVDVATQTVSEWDNYWGYNAEYVYAYTNLKSTDGVYVENLSQAINCSGRIRYAQILFTPHESIFSGSNRELIIKRVMVHELGHVLCLGHPNTEHFVTQDSSVMRQNVTYEGYYLPQWHDINDINSKY